MSDSEKYDVFWKGKIVGKYTRDEIESLSERGSLGLMHIVKTSSGDVFLKDFLFGQSKGTFEKESDLQISQSVDEINGISRNIASIPEKSRKKKRKLQRTVGEQAVIYGLCGASFVSIWLWSACLVLCLYIWIKGDSKLSIAAAMVSTAIFAFGFVFFNILLPVLRI